MKVIIAPDSFKGNLTAVEVANHIEKGVLSAGSDIIVRKIPVADGGEGTVDAMITGAGGNKVHTRVNGPLMDEIDSFFGVLGDGKTAVIEMAAASGLTLVPPGKMNPLETTTYGVGQLILAALDMGCSKFIIGLGGSSTNDGGMGMAQALGAVFYDENMKPLGIGGKYTGLVRSVDLSMLDRRLGSTNVIAACDVSNPLCGPNGASAVFGPQKGATPEMVKFLDSSLLNYGSVLEGITGKKIMSVPGSGAAGGLGAGLLAFAGAVMKPGIEIVLDSCDAENHIMGSDLVITGEGKTDAQTAFGKVPAGIASLASKYNVPVVCLSGGLGDDYEEVYKCGIDAAFSNVPDAMSPEEAKARSGEFLEKTARSIIRLVLRFAE
jgi:glycerate kinase